MATDIISSQGPIMVQSTLNPNAHLEYITDQGIDDWYTANNLGNVDKIPDVVKCARDFEENPSEFILLKKKCRKSFVNLLQK